MLEHRYTNVTIMIMIRRQRNNKTCITIAVDSASIRRRRLDFFKEVVVCGHSSLAGIALVYDVCLCIALQDLVVSISRGQYITCQRCFT